MEFRKILALFAVFLSVSGIAFATYGADVEINEIGQTDDALPELKDASLLDRWEGYYNIIFVSVYLTDSGSDSDSNTCPACFLYHWNATVQK